MEVDVAAILSDAKIPNREIVFSFRFCVMCSPVPKISVLSLGGDAS